MNVPEEAVEAAAKSLWPEVAGRSEYALADLAIALEAAAPHILAHASRESTEGRGCSIPDAAIVAATKRLAAENGWEGPYPEGLARAALEAALPHMK